MKAFDTVFDGGRVYRCLLQATALPGKLFALPPFDVDSLEAVALTLLDHEVTFCAVGAEAGETEEHISRLTGARSAPLPEADFALIPGGASGEAITQLRRGTLERPEAGATAICAVRRLSDGGSLTLSISGPGVPGERTLDVEGLSGAEAEAIRQSRAGYPQGVDVYLVDDAGQVAGLPRSARLEIVFAGATA